MQQFNYLVYADGEYFIGTQYFPLARMFADTYGRYCAETRNGAKPAIIIIDGKTGEVLEERESVTPIEFAEFSSRTNDLLDRAGITTTEQLRKVSIDDIIQTRAFDAKNTAVILEIVQYLLVADRKTKTCKLDCTVNKETVYCNEQIKRY